jgi:hypothetical protein
VVVVHGAKTEERGMKCAGKYGIITANGNVEGAYMRADAVM